MKNLLLFDAFYRSYIRSVKLAVIVDITQCCSSQILGWLFVAVQPVGDAFQRFGLLAHYQAHGIAHHTHHASIEDPEVIRKILAHLEQTASGSEVLRLPEPRAKILNHLKEKGGYQYAFRLPCTQSQELSKLSPDHRYR